MGANLKRKYQDIWERLKRDGRVKVEVHPYYVRRMKRMVSKEKDLDKGFAIETNNVKKLEYNYNTETRVLQIVLYNTQKELRYLTAEMV